MPLNSFAALCSDSEEDDDVASPSVTLPPPPIQPDDDFDSTWTLVGGSRKPSTKAAAQDAQNDPSFFSHPLPNHSKQKDLEVFTQQVPPKSLIYVDAAMILDYAFPRELCWSLKTAQDRVQFFVRAAEATGLTLKFFNDATRRGEAEEKWFQRREKEVRNGIRNFPPHHSLLISAMLEEWRVVGFFA